MHKIDETDLKDAKVNLLTLFSQAVMHVQNGHPESGAPAACGISILVHNDGNYSISLAGSINKGMLLGALADAQFKIHDLSNEWEAMGVQAMNEKSSLPPTQVN